MSSYKKPMKLSLPKNSKNFSRDSHKQFQIPKKNPIELVKKQVPVNLEQPPVVVKADEPSS